MRESTKDGVVALGHPQQVGVVRHRDDTPWVGTGQTDIVDEGLCFLFELGQAKQVVSVARKRCGTRSGVQDQHIPGADRVCRGDKQRD